VKDTAPPNATRSIRSSQRHSPGDRGIYVQPGPGDCDRLVVTPRRACYLLDCGTTHLYELIDNEEIESFLDGRSRKIVVASIHRLIGRRLAAKQGNNDVQRPRGRPRKETAAGSP
jgi:hypothetical protein